MKTSSTDLQRIQHWYASCCDGEWEHEYGMTIATLDNPGWSVIIDLDGTNLEDAVLSKPGGVLQEKDWLRCWIENKKFYGIGDSYQLTSILSRFVQLIDTTEAAEGYKG